MPAHRADGATRTPDGSRTGDLGTFLARVRRYWPLVLVVTIAAVAAGVAATKLAETAYVARTSMIVSSEGRSPDQDAVLVQGYVAYFNDTAYQRELAGRAGVPDDVDLEAGAAAASPILIVSATTSDREDAQAYAIAVAEAFRDDINEVRATERAEQLETLQERLDAALSSDDPDAGALVSDLQERIEQTRADEVNVLQPLQAEGGVAVEEPSMLRSVLPAGAGGLLLGLLGAFAVAKLSRRLPSGPEVADKVGLETLVEVPRARRKAARARQQRRLGQLANIVLARLPEPSVLAVAQPEAGDASSFVALRLAREWARQGHPTVLVTAEVDGVLDGADGAAAQVRAGSVPGLSLIHLAPRPADGTPPLTVSKLIELLGQETLAGQYVVVDVQAVVQSPTGQALCQGADQVLLVVDSQVSRVGEVREAVTVLGQMGAQLLGAVVTAAGKSERAEVAAETAEPAAQPEEPATVPEPPHDEPAVLAGGPERLDGSSLEASPSGGRPSSPGQR